MRRRHACRPLAAACAGLALAACSIEPFEVREAPAGQLRVEAEEGFQGPYMARPARRRGAENPWARANVPRTVKICYGSLSDTPGEVLAAAREFCPPPDYRLELSGQSSLLNKCPLLQPNLATFSCRRVR